MSLTTIQNSFVAGELSPDIFGRTDLAKFRQGGSTIRNFFVSYRGGAYSRAGFAYVGTCKQAGNSSPPRDIPFQFSINQGYALEFGDQYMRIKSNGAYVVETGVAITGITQANPAVLHIPSHGYSVGDWIYITGVVGMTNFNGLTWIVHTTPDSNHITVTDLFGNIVNSTTFSPYVSGGLSERIYTVVAPYSAVDLPFLKFTQSADTMTLTCVNQLTNTEYPSYELERLGQTDWTFTQDSFAATIAAPTGIVVTAQSSTTVSTYYSYVVTAVDVNGQESVASLQGSVENNDISINAGSNTISWNNVTGATSYNVYKATPAYAAPVPIGSSFGFIGTSFGGSFVDTNITADFTTVPPVHNNPFAQSPIIDVVPTAGGSGYSQSTIGYTITTSTGSGFIGIPVVVGGAFVAMIIQNGGQNYALTDTIAITGGTGATATLSFGPATGVYPGACAYYQQRRAYAATLDNPDTYYMSQPGLFNNMDSSIPTTDSDAIVGAPWAQQINGIQFMVPMPGGLVILTGKGAWQLNGGNNAALTPADQTANPQAYNGCHFYVPPIVINYDILYVQAKGSIVRDLSYNFFVNIYTGTDLTVLSNHLFTGHSIQQWAWSEEPYKLVWVVREDGIMLSLTYLKEQDIYAWARHDTNGLFVGVCSITEAQTQSFQLITQNTPYVDAVYCIVKRYVNGQWMYYSERLDDRIWQNVEDCFCVDAGLEWPMTFPNATLSPVSAEGTSNITGTLLVTGGIGYTTPVATAIDPTGKGSGATFSITVVLGVITAVIPLDIGENYIPGTKIEITDPTGSGAVVYPVITNNVTFNASSSVFSNSNVGQVIRVGGGKATVTSYVSGTQVIANIIQPITDTIPNDPNFTPVPQVAGNWSITSTTTSISGLNHLEGLTVTTLADGSVVPQQQVINGTIVLPTASSAIIVGLPYTCQLQAMYLDPPAQEGTTQSKRKLIPSVAVRMYNSRGLSVGCNQPDASTQPDGANVPWTGLIPIKERNSTMPPGTAIPLFTGDEYINIEGNWETTGQVAVEQNNPLPANILGFISYFQIGDTSG